MLRTASIDTTVYWGGHFADVELLGVEEQERWFGVFDPARLPVIGWDRNVDYWRTFHHRAAVELDARLEPGDLIGVIGGAVSQEIVDRYRDRFTVIEPGVGYEGICRDTFACFESYAWMHNRYGAHGIGDGRPFDTVIPNAVDPDEWGLAPSDGYALFVGRGIARKGPHVAAQIAEKVGLPLVMAGAGVAEQGDNWVRFTDGTVAQSSAGLTHVGAVSGQPRRDLFARAEVFICPTLYIGPWEGVHAEAMMSGVGVAAPDYGVFCETLQPATRYRSMSQAVAAVEHARKTRGQQWRDRAIDLCGIDRCSQMYADWVDRLMSLRDGRNGWYA